jgi:hypothetical protein
VYTSFRRKKILSATVLPSHVLDPAHGFSPLLKEVTRARMGSLIILTRCFGDNACSYADARSRFGAIERQAAFVREHCLRR